MTGDAVLWHRIQFAFTITYHGLFPQLTMGLAWFLVYWKWPALRTGDEQYNQAARWATTQCEGAAACRSFSTAVATNWINAALTASKPA
jgi:hypothetical protein